MTYSYDIFDTILYRKVPSSMDIFTLMDDNPDVRRLYPGNFSEARRKAEFWLRRKSSHEVTISGIYHEMKYPKEQAKELIRIELQTEIKYSFLNKTIVDEIKQHISKGDKVILISDMYWNEKSVRKILASKDQIFESLPIYVSCAHDATKSSGKLYELVRDKEQLVYREWTHTGDNKKSDYESAKKLGITAVLVKPGRRYQFEKKISSLDNDSKLLYGIVSETRQKSNGTAYDLGASFAGPMVYQYVEWVLTEAEKRRINQLYFVLRDGYILKKVADIIIKDRGLGIKTDYLFGSRVAWRFPEITIDELKNLSVWNKSNWIFRDPAYAYVPFERMGFSREQLVELFGADFPDKELHSFADFKAVLDAALGNENFCEQLKRNIAESGELLKEYLESAMGTSTSFALVDTNSTGKTQRDLNKFIWQFSTTRLRFFYHTFLSDEEPNKDTQFVFLNVSEQDRRFPEALFRAPYKPCYGYKKEDGKVVPKFASGKYCAWNYSFDYDSYLKGIEQFTENMQREDHSLDRYVDLLMKVANFDVVSPDVIKIMAKLPFNPDMNGNEILDFYPQIKASNLTHPFSELIYFPKGSYYRNGGAWPGVYQVLYGMVKLKRSRRK